MYNAEVIRVSLMNALPRGNTWHTLFYLRRSTLKKKDAIQRFEEIAAQNRFKGWSLVGGYEFGENIPFFGKVLKYKLRTGNGEEEYFSLLRHFGWVVVFGVTNLRDNIYPNTDAGQHVITLCQWKPGVNKASWELPPGGIGKVPPGAGGGEILEKTQESYLKETGYGGGDWTYLGHIMIETGKYRGAGPDDHGLPAHMFLATELEKRSGARNPNPNEIMETILVPLEEFNDVIDSGLFVEASALPCALLALRKLGQLKSVPTSRMETAPEIIGQIGRR